MLRVEIRSELKLLDRKLAETILKSLEPDNIDIPHGISLNVEIIDDKLVINIGCVQEKILSCRSTLDEILMHISNILDSLRSLTK
ncbi:MAG: KEOPS complex subunit Pcc1 [Sulfolobales archaeon]|jgi:hypothetical protein